MMCRCRSSDGIRTCRTDSHEDSHQDRHIHYKKNITKNLRKRQRRFTRAQWKFAKLMDILLLLVGIYGVVKFSDTIKDILVNPVVSNCSRPKLRYLCGEKKDSDHIITSTQDWWVLSSTAYCRELIVAAPKTVKLELSCSLVIANASMLTTTVSCIPYDNLRADRPNGKDNISYSFQGKKISPEPFYSLDDACEHDGSALCLPKSSSHKTTVCPSVPYSRISLAGVNSEPDAAIVKPPASEHDRPATKSEITTKENKLVADYRPETTVAKPVGYNRATYPVLIGNSVKVYSTKDFADLPHQDYFMVKERIKNDSGVTKAKLTLKHCTTKSYETDESNIIEKDSAAPGFSKLQHYEYGEALHYRENSTNPGHVVFTCKGIFSGNMKYPLPTRKATDNRIGKGGNGFVFTIVHERREYAVKKTVYRANEVNVHAALRHENILPLVAVLMGDRHEHHSRKFYCYHFMPKMDCDLRQIMSTREVGCLKHFYNNCGNDLRKWETGFSNIKFILGKTLKALAYLHDNGYVHRDIKASNIMIKMRCRCQPLSCRCSSKFQVKLGDFDSAGTVPGLGIKEPTDQMIKFASILPLGTPGYRAPEVSMHITLSGPYETLYTFTVDMWSFGCLCLNICIAKTAALKQREEASLLLSRSHTCSKELWEKTTKTKELENTKPFSDETDLVTLVKRCLQVNSADRPSAKEALTVFQQATGPS